MAGQIDQVIFMTLQIGTDYLFDTEVFIGILRNRKEPRKLLYQARFLGVSVGYSIITEAELWQGIAGLRTEQQHKILLRPFTRYFINVTIARRAGEIKRLLHEKHIRQHNQRPFLADCFIAATAEYYGLTICTNDKKDFNLFHDHFSIPLFEYAN